MEGLSATMRLMRSSLGWIVTIIVGSEDNFSWNTDLYGDIQL